MTKKQVSDKVLHLNLKKKWFDLIDSEQKKEEYREIKKYWTNRLFECHQTNLLKNKARPYKIVVFKNGYRLKPECAFEVLSIELGQGKAEWGAQPFSEYYVIKLGKKLQRASEAFEGFTSKKDFWIWKAN